MLARHRHGDQAPVEPSLTARESARCERLIRQAAELRDWLCRNPDDRRGSRGAVIKSNRTDNDSAKMATDKGVIQGYTGVAAVDSRHQIICAAQAHGTGAEHALLVPVVSQLQPMLEPHSLITADAGYHSKANLLALDRLHVNALIADNQMRKRDERFSKQSRHKAAPDPLYDKARKAVTKKPPCFAPSDFTYDASTGHCVCPAGKRLYRHGSHCQINGKEAIRFQGAKRDCVPCTLRERCLRTPEKTATRQVAFFKQHMPTHADHLLRSMRERIDSAEGRAQYGERFATVEPVFGNLRYNKRLSRFTLRSRQKVDGQWQLFCLVHNIEKLANARAAA